MLTQKSRDSSVCHISPRRPSSASTLTATARESQGQSPADSAPHRLARLSSSHSGALFVSHTLAPLFVPYTAPRHPISPAVRPLALSLYPRRLQYLAALIASGPPLRQIIYASRSATNIALCRPLPGSYIAGRSSLFLLFVQGKVCALRNGMRCI